MNAEAKEEQSGAPADEEQLQFFETGRTPRRNKAVGTFSRTEPRRWNSHNAARWGIRCETQGRVCVIYSGNLFLQADDTNFWKRYSLSKNDLQTNAYEFFFFLVIYFPQ